MVRQTRNLCGAVGVAGCVCVWSCCQSRGVNNVGRAGSNNLSNLSTQTHTPLTIAAAAVATHKWIHQHTTKHLAHQSPASHSLCKSTATMMIRTSGVEWSVQRQPNRQHRKPSELQPKAHKRTQTHTHTTNANDATNKLNAIQNLESVRERKHDDNWPISIGIVASLFVW
jgi:hypothetical protein